MSSDGYLSFEHGEVWLGSQLLPGILVNQSVRGQVRFDEGEEDNLSGRQKVPLGWEDAEITLVMALTTQNSSVTCYHKLRTINELFKGYDNDTNPRVLDVLNAHLSARGIDQVVFSGLESQETEEDDTITVTLMFVEHNPPIMRAEREQVASDTGSNATPEANAATGDGIDPIIVNAAGTDAD